MKALREVLWCRRSPWWSYSCLRRRPDRLPRIWPICTNHQKSRACDLFFASEKNPAVRSRIEQTEKGVAVATMNKRARIEAPEEASSAFIPGTVAVPTSGSGSRGDE